MSLRPEPVNLLLSPLPPKNIRGLADIPRSLTTEGGKAMWRRQPSAQRAPPAALRDRVALTRLLDDVLKEECLERLDQKSAARSGPFRRPSWTESEDGRPPPPRPPLRGESPPGGSETPKRMQASASAPSGKRFNGSFAAAGRGAADTDTSALRSAAAAAHLSAAPPPADGAAGAVDAGRAPPAGGGEDGGGAAPAGGGVSEEAPRRHKHLWTVGDRVLGQGPLHPDGVAAIWTVTDRSPFRSSRRTAKGHACEMASAIEGHADAPAARKMPPTDHVVSPAAAAATTLPGEAALAATSAAVAAARAAVGPAPPAHGPDSLLRTSIRAFLQV